jgi:(+)-pinoresinol hydroxylase
MPKKDPMRHFATRVLGILICSPVVLMAAKVPVPSAVERGRAVYQYSCATCHSTGPQMPGTDALAVKYNGSKPAALENRSDLTGSDIEFFTRHGVNMMPSFRKTEVSDKDMQDLIAYLTRKQR